MLITLCSMTLFLFGGILFIRGHLQLTDLGPLPHTNTRLGAFRYLTVFDRRRASKITLGLGIVLGVVGGMCLLIFTPFTFIGVVTLCIYTLWTLVFIVISPKEYKLLGISSKNSGEFARKMGDREPVWFSSSRHFFTWSAFLHFKSSAEPGFHYSVYCKDTVVRRFTK